MAMSKAERKTTHVLQNVSEVEIIATWLLMATGSASNHQAPDSA
jgi:hypothetical protein